MNERLFFIAILIVSLMRFPHDTLLAKWLLVITVCIIVLMPLHATITVWLASNFDHYTAFRLWKEFLLGIGLVFWVMLLIKNPELRDRLWKNPFLRPIIILIGIYIVLYITSAGVALLREDVTLKALGYGVISNVRYLIFFAMCVTLKSYYNTWIKTHWKTLLLGPAGIVVGFGLLQAFVLPIDVLKHAGYGPETITPYIAVDQKDEYARIQSTLRGPNPLGAYLVLVITVLTGLLLAKRLRSWQLPLAITMTLVVLYGTYSRSAYIGAAFSIAVLIWLMAGSVYVRKLLLVCASVLLLIGAGTVFALKDNDHIQNILFHTDEHSRSADSSNASRADALLEGLNDIGEQPLGRGPGTAGPASVYNDGNARIAENYFIQIAQEVGLVGVAIFIAICYAVGSALWYVRKWGVLPVVLLAALVGLSAVNFVSHAWADDTVAYVWWGSAGLVLGAAIAVGQKGEPRAKKTV